jgi:hypothetical protein
MSPAITALSSVGITHSMMILGVMFVAIAVVLGMYWHIILPGAMLLGVAVLFVSPDGTQPVAKLETPAPVVEKVVTEKDQYMEDCIEVAEYTKKQCEKLWSNRQAEEEELAVDETELKLLDVSNKEYKARRAAALKKPGAVVGHVTYH